MTQVSGAPALCDTLQGLLLGTAVGDALGLPAEGMSADRIRRKWRGQWRHRFLFARGMISDDTEHTLFVAQALLSLGNDLHAFRRSLAWKLQLWLLGAPAGIGLATLKATLRLWVGFSPERSGVYSAGNGPAMRSAIIGTYFAADGPRIGSELWRGHGYGRSDHGHSVRYESWRTRDSSGMATRSLGLAAVSDRAASGRSALGGAKDPRRTEGTRALLLAWLALAQCGVCGHGAGPWVSTAFSTLLKASRYAVSRRLVSHTSWMVGLS